jgi:hypothetical protein
MADELTELDWATMVISVLADHPEWAGTTVQAMQSGILMSNDRLRERIATVSMGLVEAINTKPNHVKRRHDFIIDAVNASTVAGSKWAKETIEREQNNGTGSKEEAV